MSAEIIDGKKCAEEFKQNLRKQILELKAEEVEPSLIAIQIGQNSSSKIYIDSQRNSCEALGVNYTLWNLSENTSQKALENHIQSINSNPSIHGIILQQPLPSHIDPIKTIQAINPNKDVEGLHPLNYGRLFYHEHFLAPCTALAAYNLLKWYEPDLKGKEITIVGHSSIVGKPLTMLFLESKSDAPTIRNCHVSTKDLKHHTLNSDIIIVACGVPNLITEDMVHENSIIIDIGINRVEKKDHEGKLILNSKTGKPKKFTVGDVDFEPVSKKCKAISPVPGGVGPVTIAMLLNNTLKCARLIADEENNK